MADHYAIIKEGNLYTVVNDRAEIVPEGQGLSLDQLALRIISLHEENEKPLHADPDELPPDNSLYFSTAAGCEEVKPLLAMSDHMNKLYNRADELGDVVKLLRKQMKRAKEELR